MLPVYPCKVEAWNLLIRVAPSHLFKKRSALLLCHGAQLVGRRRLRRAVLP